MARLRCTALHYATWLSSERAANSIRVESSRDKAEDMT